jgi:PAS domain S-box-containing protein
LLALLEEIMRAERAADVMDALAAAAAVIAGYGAALLTVAWPEGTLIGTYNLTPEECDHFRSRARAVPFHERAGNRRRIRERSFPGTAIAFIPQAAEAEWHVRSSPPERYVHGTWQPDDALYVLIHGVGGEERGVVSFDAPDDGCAPTVDNLVRLQRAKRFLDLAGGLLETRILARSLRASEERFVEVADHMRAVLWMTSADKRQVLFVNKAYEEIWGRSRDELIARPLSWTDAIHPEDRDRVLTDLAGRQARGEYAEEYRIERPDGSVRWIRERAFPIEAEGGGVARLGGLAEDFTRERETERLLQQAQNLEVVGRLAGGVAHDFNNLLVVIDGYSSFLLDNAAAGSQEHKKLSAIADAALQARRLTNELMTFSAKGLVRATVFDLRETLAGAWDLLVRLLEESVEATLVLPETPVWIRAEPVQIERVLLNLASNARDAMPSGGSLDVTLAHVSLDARALATRPGIAPGPFARWEVRDCGGGIPASALPHVFEPFFTTKGPHEGTGLGLATVYGIASQAGGFTDVTSEVGVGTSFVIYLPVCEEPSTARPQHSAHPARTGPSGGETVLLVEDEPAVRSVVQKMLETCDYHVLVAKDGADALALARTHGDAIAILLTDVVMPQMNGDEVAMLVRQIIPGVRVLFTSGYTGDVVLRHGVEREQVAFLDKPFTATELATAIADLLAS